MSQLSQLSTALLVAMVLWAVPAQPVVADEADTGAFEAAAAAYADNKASGYLSSQSFVYQTGRIFSGEGQRSSFKLGLTEKKVTYREEDSAFVKEQLDGSPSVTELSATASCDQGLAVGTRVGVLAGTQHSKVGDSRFFGVRAGQWWRRETLETTAEIRRTDADQKPITGTDFDGTKIALPENLEGYNLALGVTAFITTSTIVTASNSYTTRNDRPPANGTAFGARQFISATRSALHLGVAHYENVGVIDAVTFTGSIVANSAYAEWHQRLFDRFIVMGGYRYYAEEERPRSEGAERKRVGSDQGYATMRWRPGAEPWTQDGPEIYVFTSRYTTNEPLSGTVGGLGAKLIW